MSRFTRYQKRLFVFLSVAAFFDGYDLFAISQLLPELRRYFGVGESAGGDLVAIINVGTLLAYFLVRSADRWGRKRILTITIAGYTLTTFASGLAPDIVTFGAMQLLGRFFLLAEAAVAMIVIAEEFPAADRGLVLGVVAAITGLGSIACVALAPVLLSTPLGWRTVYLVSAAPLVLVAWARRGLKETSRYERSVSQGSSAGTRRSFFEIWRSPHRRRAAQLGVIWMVAYIAPQTAVIFWKEFAVHDRGFSATEVAQAISLGALLAMPLNFFAGKLMDVVGRRHAAAIVFVTCGVGTYGAYTLETFWPLAGCLVLAIFGVSAFYPVLNAFNTELFPTELRADAYGWCNNLIGRVGYIIAPAIVGGAAAVSGWGAAVRPVAVLPIVAMVLVYWLLPETTRRELEETSAVPGAEQRA